LVPRRKHTGADLGGFHGERRGGRPHLVAGKGPGTDREVQWRAPDGVISSLAARDTAGTWAVQTTPDVTGATETELTGVACPTATPCSASGYAVTGSGDTTVLARLSAGTWSVLPTGGVTGDGATGLNALACSSSTVCTAAGSGPDGLGRDDALIEQS
jgi:hypothetical protein